MKKLQTFFSSFLLLFTLLSLLFSSSTYSQALVNANATPEAKQLKTFLDSIYGKKILSGQAFESVSEQWLSIISNASGGKQPAILSLDFMNSTPWRVEQGADPDTTANMAIDWAKHKGGIVEMHWHWDAPKNTNFSTWQGFYSKNTTFDLAYALSDTTTEDYQLLIRDMDIIAALLKRMQDSSVAVLWRPLHEAEGTWFWWGAKGGNACKELWNIMYNRFVNIHGINNLIWVWNSYGTTKQNWYPGDDVVDIIAWDYPDYNQNSGSWSQYQNMFGESGKLFALGEDGKLIDPNTWENQKWLYFITWAYMIKDPSQQNGKNTTEWINTVYNDSRVLTLDDLIPGPKAKAGHSQLLFDTNGDGFETVLLDGTASKTESGTIDTYLWTENDIEIATGSTASVQLSIGVHEITLKITTSTGESASSKVVITIKTPSLSLNSTFTVSSTEANLGNLPENAIDGDLSTRWSSLYTDPQWYQIDLGKPYDIKEAVIYWEVAGAKDYRIDESNDGITWTTVVNKTNMATGQRTDKLENLEGGARYIRMYGISRTTTYGYSIYEFEVYGTENPDAKPVGELVASKKSTIENTFTIYPTLLKQNETLNISNPDKNGSAKIKIYNVIGKTAFEQTINKEHTQLVIDNRFHKGIYILTIESQAGVASRKFVVE